MELNRRSFLKASGLAGVAVSSGLLPLPSFGAESQTKKAK